MFGSMRSHFLLLSAFKPSLSFSFPPYDYPVFRSCLLAILFLPLAALFSLIGLLFLLGSPNTTMAPGGDCYFWGINCISYVWIVPATFGAGCLIFGVLLLLAFFWLSRHRLFHQQSPLPTSSGGFASVPPPPPPAPLLNKTPPSPPNS